MLGQFPNIGFPDPLNRAFPGYGGGERGEKKPRRGPAAEKINPGLETMILLKEYRKAKPNLTLDYLPHSDVSREGVIRDIEKISEIGFSEKRAARGEFFEAAFWEGINNHNWFFGNEEENEGSESKAENNNLEYPRAEMCFCLPTTDYDDVINGADFCVGFRLRDRSETGKGVKDEAKNYFSVDITSSVSSLVLREKITREEKETWNGKLAEIKYFKLNSNEKSRSLKHIPRLVLNLSSEEHNVFSNLVLKSGLKTALEKIELAGVVGAMRCQFSFQLERLIIGLYDFGHFNLSSLLSERQKAIIGHFEEFMDSDDEELFDEDILRLVRNLVREGATEDDLKTIDKENIANVEIYNPKKDTSLVKNEKVKYGEAIWNAFQACLFAGVGKNGGFNKDDARNSFESSALVNPSELSDFSWPEEVE